MYVQLPAGTGLEVNVLITVPAGNTLLQSDPRPWVGYAGPIITHLFHANCTFHSSGLINCPRAGGGLVTITGSNFGQSILEMKDRRIVCCCVLFVTTN